MLYIFDRNENLLEVITDYKEFKYIKKLNSDRTLSFEIEKNNNIKKYNKVGFFDIDKNFQLFFIDDFTSFKDANTEKINVDCLADFYRLGNTLIDDKRATTLSDAVTKCLENSDYKVRIVEAFEDRDINFYHISRIKALNEIINAFKCEIDIRIEINESTGRIGNKFIDFKHRLGTDTAIRFTYDTALESVEKTTLEGHFNVLWGWGKSLETENGGFSRKLDFADINNGKKYIEDTESIAKYGRLEGIFEDSKIEDKAILLKATKEKLAETKELKMSYKASIKDISKLSGYNHFKVNLGDTIVVLDEEIKEVIEARIIGIEEDKENEKSESDIEITLGNFLPALSDDDLDDILGNLNDKIDNIPKPDIPDADTIFPDILPKIPVVEAQGLFSSVILSWSYENKLYYTYEVFASKIKDFMPDSSNRIFEGKASSYLHEVKPDETWYYRVRGKNSYGKVTDYSTQVEATTKKIADGTQYFEELAIGHALIASLDLDKATVGKLTAQFLDVYNLVVADGNGNKTLEIDDFGRIYMNVTELKIASKSVETQEGASDKIDKAIKDYTIVVDKEFSDINSAYNNLENTMNTSFKDGIVSQAEAKAINERLVALEKEKSDIDGEYNTIYSNASLNNTTEKQNLLNAKNSYNTAYTNLKNSITTGINDGLIDSSEISNINIKTNEYKVSSAIYKEAFINSVDKLGSVKASTAETNANNFTSSEIKQVSDSITQRVESVENTTTSHTATINSHTSSLNAVDGKINTAKTDAINTSKVDATTKANDAKNQAISSASTDAQNKANKALNDAKSYTGAEITKVNSTMTSKFAEIKTTTDSITQTVSNTNKEVETVKVNITNAQNTANTANSKIDGLELGGRNLLPKNSLGLSNSATGTFDSNTNTWTLTATPSSSSWGRGLYIKTPHNIIIPYGKCAIYSFEIKVSKQITWNTDVNNAPVSGSAWSSNDNDDTTLRKTSSKIITKVNEWVKCWSYISNTSSKNTAKIDIKDSSSTFGIVTTNETSNVNFQIRNFKVELGNKATDWTPAPEDISKEILDVTTEKVNQAKADIKITTDAISSKVSQVESTTNSINGKVNSHESRIATAEQKITPNAIINTVQSTVNQAKDDAINAANSSTDNKLKNYLTTSKFTEFKQSTEDFQLAVTQSSNYNLFKRHLLPNRLQGDDFHMVEVEGVDNTCTSQGIRSRNNTSFRYNGILSKAGVYSVSFLARSRNSNEAYVTLDLCDNNAKEEYLIDRHWRSFKFENITVPTANDIYNFMDISFNNGAKTWEIDFCKIMINEGALAQEWTQGGGELISGITTINENGVKCAFENGTRAEMGRNGFYYKTGDGQWEYHALSTVGTIRVPSEETRTITLPTVFRNKNFRVICTVSQIGTGNDAINNPKALISFWAGSDQHDIHAGTFRLYGSTRLRNNDGSIAYRDKEVEISYTVLA